MKYAPTAVSDQGFKEESGSGGTSATGRQRLHSTQVSSRSGLAGVRRTVGLFAGEHRLGSGDAGVARPLTVVVDCREVVSECHRSSLNRIVDSVSTTSSYYSILLILLQYIGLLRL
jgi:hypothetical protein